MAKEKVLLVDDDEEFTSVMAERLESRDIRTETVNNGYDAIKKASEVAYDAIILDLAMPGIDGLKTLQIMLQKNPDLQIILLTGVGSIEKGVEAVKLGAKDFLEKPADFDKLLEKIKIAGERRMLLTEKNIAEKMNDILKKKGW